MSLNHLLKARIEVVAHRKRRLWLWCRLATCWAGAGLLGLAAVILEREGYLSASIAMALVVLVAGLSLVTVLLLALRQTETLDHWRKLAGEIESRHPD